MFIITFLIILFLVIIVPSLLLSLVARIIAFFKFGSNRRAEREEGAAHEPHDDRRACKQKRQKKIFDKNEGEYVDFEEIK